MSKTIETDLKTFVKFWLVPILILLALFIIEKALTGLIIIGASIFLALALRPLVSRVDGFFPKHFGKDKKHQNLSAVLAYLIVILVVGAVIAIIGPVVVNETSKFVQKFPETFETTFGGWDGVNSFGQSIGVQDLHAEIDNALDGLSKNIMGILGNSLVSSVSGAADIIMKVVLVLVLTLLFLLEGPGMLHGFWNGLEDKDNKKMVNVAKALRQAGLDIPIMIGGATTSQLHVALKIAPVYGGPVVWMKDASLCVGIKLLLSILQA